MTFQTDTYTGTGVQTAMSVTSSSNDVFIHVHADDDDVFDIQYKLDSTGLTHTMQDGDNRSGEIVATLVDIPAVEIFLNITTNNSSHIEMEIKEF